MTPNAEKKPHVSIVVTAYNEEENLPRLLTDIAQLHTNYRLDIIVVDDGSRDDTRKVAKSFKNVRVLTNITNRGKGAAFRKGYKAANGDYVIQIDADYQFIPADIPRLMIKLQKGFDVALGTRYDRRSTIDEESVNYIRKIGSRFLSQLTTLAAKRKVTDVMAGFKGFKKDVLDNTRFLTNHFGYEAEVVIKAAKKGYTIVNVPIRYKRRKAGKSNVNSVRDGFLVAATIIKAWVTYV